MCLSTASWVERNGHQYYNVIWNIHAPGIAGVSYVNDVIREWARNGEVNAITSSEPCYSAEIPLKFWPLHHMDWTSGLIFLNTVWSPANETHCRVALWDFSLHRPREQPQEVGNKPWVIFWIAYDGIICTIPRYRYEKMFFYLKYISFRPAYTWNCIAPFSFSKCSTSRFLQSIACCSISNLAISWRTSFWLSSNCLSSCRHWVHIEDCWWLEVEEGIL